MPAVELFAELEVFFDYACPYCLKGHENLSSLLPSYPRLKVKWRPCEAHPRPERYGSHSDLCARGYYFAQANGVDVMEYHRRTYAAAIHERLDIEDLSVLSQKLEGLLGADEFCQALSGGAYIDELHENNRLAWGVYSFPAVPSYQMNGKILMSIENIGVRKEKLAEFLFEFCK